MRGTRGKQVAQIAASIREFGFTNPVLVDGEQGIIAGHGRVLAAHKLGMDLIPTIELAYLTAAQRQAYKITDNKLALNAGWDAEMLRIEMGELQELGFDLALTGFDDVELPRARARVHWKFHRLRWAQPTLTSAPPSNPYRGPPMTLGSAAAHSFRFCHPKKGSALRYRRSPAVLPDGRPSSGSSARPSALS
jgi:hypothetical protein